MLWPIQASWRKEYTPQPPPPKKKKTKKKKQKKQTNNKQTNKQKKVIWIRNFFIQWSKQMVELCL